MEIFLDSADLDEVSAVLDRGFARGLTTNPTLVRGQASTDPVAHLKRLVELVEERDPSWSVSVQVTTRDPAEMLRQADLLADSLAYKRLAVKVPCSWDALRVIRTLTDRGIDVNCTACVTTNQAVLAAAAGARYVSMFLGKMTDTGIDAPTVLARSAKLVEGYGAKLVVGSIRRPYDIAEIAWSGAHIATVPYAWFQKIVAHEKTDEAVDAFAKNFLPFD